MEIYVVITRHNGTDVTTEPAKVVGLDSTGAGRYSTVPESVNSFAPSEYIEIWAYTTACSIMTKSTKSGIMMCGDKDVE